MYREGGGRRRDPHLAQPATSCKASPATTRRACAARGSFPTACGSSAPRARTATRVGEASRPAYGWLCVGKVPAKVAEHVLSAPWVSRARALCGEGNLDAEVTEQAGHPLPPTNKKVLKELNHGPLSQLVEKGGWAPLGPVERFPDSSWRKVATEAKIPGRAKT